MNDRIALVTGAGRGIGRASALALAAQGCRVAVTARTASELARVCAEIADGGGDALAVRADLSERDAPQEIVAEVEQAWGPVEILVNNAGIGSSASPMPLVDFDDAFWELTMAVNVTAPYRLTRLVLPSMLHAGWGRIINIASINARVPSLHGAAYIASKHALAGLTKASALEVGGHGITCNAVCPGATATLTNDLRLEYDAERLGKTVEELAVAASPLGRRILPEEVAAAVAFLASDPANAINGQLVNVCGGTLMA
jgi:3-hydroxybutyrate dehydrogenase